MIYSLMNSGYSGMPLIILGIILMTVLVFSLSIHEVMHGFVAYKLGDDTAKLQGRLTLNPLAHLDPIGTLMMLIAGIGWAKPVPVNYSRLTRYKNRYVSIRLVSIAGVMSNLALAVISYFLSALIFVIGIKTVSSSFMPSLNSFSSFPEALLSVFYYLFSFFYSVNLMLMAFNLLPIPPLDWYHFIDTFLPYKWKQKLGGYERNIGFILLAIILVGNFTGFNPLIKVIQFIELPFEFIISTPIDALANFVIHLF